MSVAFSLAKVRIDRHAPQLSDPPCGPRRRRGQRGLFDSNMPPVCAAAGLQVPGASVPRPRPYLQPGSRGRAAVSHQVLRPQDHRRDLYCEQLARTEGVPCVPRLCSGPGLRVWHGPGP